MSANDKPPTSDVTPPASAALTRGAVAQFEYADPITGERLDGLGIVVDVPDNGGPVTVAPVQRFYLSVSAEAVQVVELDG